MLSILNPPCSGHTATLSQELRWHAPPVIPSPENLTSEKVVWYQRALSPRSSIILACFPTSTLFSSQAVDPLCLSRFETCTSLLSCYILYLKSRLSNHRDRITPCPFAVYLVIPFSSPPTLNLARPHLKDPPHGYLSTLYLYIQLKYKSVGLFIPALYGRNNPLGCRYTTNDEREHGAVREVNWAIWANSHGTRATTNSPVISTFHRLNGSRSPMPSHHVTP